MSNFSQDSLLFPFREILKDSFHSNGPIVAKGEGGGGGTISEYLFLSNTNSHTDPTHLNGEFAFKPYNYRF